MNQLQRLRRLRAPIRAGLLLGAVGFAVVAVMPSEMPGASAATVHYAYVVNSLSGSVSVINTATNTVVKTVKVAAASRDSQHGPLGVAVTPNGSYAYVTVGHGYSAGSVSVIEIATNTVVKTVKVGNLPLGIAVTPNGKYAYTANLLSGSVSVINTATNTVVKTVKVHSPRAIAVTPNGKYAYTANGDGASVSVINTATNTVVKTLKVDSRYGGSASWIAITPNGKYAYVPLLDTRYGDNGPDDLVNIISTATNTVVKNITVDPRPFGVAVTPNGTYAYITHSSTQGDGSVSVIKVATNTVVKTVKLGPSSPFGVAVSPDGKYAYVANEGSRSVSVIKIATNTVVKNVKVGNDPIGIAIT